MASSNAPPSATFANSASTYQAALLSLFNSGTPESTESDLSKLLLPSFTIRANDEEGTLDFAGFVAHIRWLRGFVHGKVTLEITQFLRDGNQLAERHSSTMAMPDGTVGEAETFQFAEIGKDGRIAWIVENVRHVKGDPRGKGKEE